MRKLIFTYLVVLMAVRTVLGQDIHFSQYFVAPQLLNPSAFGVMNSFEAGLQYKGQWNSFTNGYTSFAAFANKSFRSQKKANSSKAYVSAGLNLIYDKAGSLPLTSFKAEIPVNVTKRVSNTGFLTAGLYVGFGQMAMHNNNLSWGNQFDGYQYNSSLGSNEVVAAQNKNYADCGVGVSHVLFKDEKDGEKDMSLPRNMIGFSASHLNRPAYSLYGADVPLQMRFNFYEYYYLYFNNSDLSLVPSLLAQYQGNAYELIVGAQIRRRFKDIANPDKRSKYIGAGLFYRMGDVCAVNVMAEMSNYSLGINYDFNVSKLTSSSKSFGGLEISLKIVDPFRYSNKNAGTILEKF